MSKQSSGQLTDGQLWTWWFISIFVYLLSVSLPSLPFVYHLKLRLSLLCLPFPPIFILVYLCSASLYLPSRLTFISLF